MDNKFAFFQFLLNCNNICGMNGSALNYSKIFRGNRQIKVRYSILIYNTGSKDDFDEIIYSLKFNPPSLREFGNVYDDRNENYMNYF